MRSSDLTAWGYTPQDRYYVVVTGNIGAGKSTLIRGLQRYLSEAGWAHHTIHEYLDDPATGAEGHRQLQQWLAGEKTNREFEEYIVGYYRSALARDIGLPDVVLMERSPLEITRIFLSEADPCWGEINTQVESLMSRYAIPGLTAGLNLTRLSGRTAAANLEQAVLAIEGDLASGSSAGRILYLDAPPGVCIERIAVRGRQGESGYDLGYLENLGHRYAALWDSWDCLSGPRA